ncbi:hypothetical protein CVU75_03580 [Candidatus Dependentiae bacterium HGW-Dependentiae-1]|nr:MAG: hypothetical protein CVU75_03580 [Candidatus Dependentiae bacterium HGW-Dependentiae-1]
MSLDWYVFSALGTLLTTQHRHGTCFGKSFLYEGGLACNVAYREKKWLLDLMVEFNGLFSGQSKIFGVVDKNSGGNSIFVGPSFYFATPRFWLQGGIAFPVAQHLFGTQGKAQYGILFDASWKFN